MEQRFGTPEELGRIFHDARVAAGYTQAEAAKRAHVSRRWIIELEAGHINARLGHIIEALRAIGHELKVVPVIDRSNNPLDAILAQYREPSVR